MDVCISYISNRCGQILNLIKIALQLVQLYAAIRSYSLYGLAQILNYTEPDAFITVCENLVLNKICLSHFAQLNLPR